MNSRLTIKELAGILSVRTGKDVETVERFLREFVVVVTESVFADRVVKVKGLGTFKIIPVEKRESIHVNTGERIEIPSHFKFSFVPDKELKEIVNKPFSFFETTEINEGVQFPELEEGTDIEPESEEEVDGLSSAQAMPEKESVPVALVEQPELSDSKPIFGETKILLSSEQKVEPVAAGQEPLLPVPAHVATLSEQIGELDRKQPGYKFCVASFVLLLALLLGVGGYFLYPWMKGEMFQKETPSVVMPEVAPVKLDSQLVTAFDTLAKKPEVDTLCMDISLEKGVILQQKEIGKDTISHGDRLTMIALKYYGHKIFWVYLYDYNKDSITDPNNVPIGTEIRIPAPELYGIDAKDPVSREKAAVRQTEILTKNH